MLTDTQLQLIQNVVSAIIGAGSSIVLQWVGKKKSKSEEVNEGVTVLSKASSDYVQTAQGLIKTLQEMLDEKDVQIREDIDEAKADCHKEIMLLRYENNELVEDLRAKIIELTIEKEQMSREIVSLTLDKHNQKEQIATLTMKLAKYQSDLDDARRDADEETTDKILD